MKKYLQKAGKHTDKGKTSKVFQDIVAQTPEVLEFKKAFLKVYPNADEDLANSVAIVSYSKKYNNPLIKKQFLTDLGDGDYFKGYFLYNEYINQNKDLEDIDIYNTDKSQENKVSKQGDSTIKEMQDAKDLSYVLPKEWQLMADKLLYDLASLEEDIKESVYYLQKGKSHGEQKPITALMKKRDEIIKKYNYIKDKIGDAIDSIIPKSMINRIANIEAFKDTSKKTKTPFNEDLSLFNPLLKEDIEEELAKKELQFAKGGKVYGPSHQEGGVPAIDVNTGEQVAEVEGGERIFSREDTQAMEEMVMQIVNSQNEQQANQLAMELGYMVVQMILNQIERQNMEMSKENTEMNSLAMENQIPMAMKGKKLFELLNSY